MLNGKGKPLMKRARKDAGSVRPSGRAVEEEIKVKRGFAKKQQLPSVSRKTGKYRGQIVPKRSPKCSGPTMPATMEGKERERKSRSPQKPRPKKGKSLTT